MSKEEFIQNLRDASVEFVEGVYGKGNSPGETVEKMVFSAMVYGASAAYCERMGIPITSLKDLTKED